jgi:pimeloyl-ACP methyl ester carboxylesterase
VPGSGEPLFQAAAANLNPWTEAKVDTKNPDRGPLLIISGELDHTVPPAIANASYKREKRNPGITEIVEMKGRGHSLMIDAGWKEVGPDGARLREALRLIMVEPGRDREPRAHADHEEALEPTRDRPHGERR